MPGRCLWGAVIVVTASQFRLGLGGLLSRFGGKTVSELRSEDGFICRVPALPKEVGHVGFCDVPGDAERFGSASEPLTRWKALDGVVIAQLAVACAQLITAGGLLCVVQVTGASTENVQRHHDPILAETASLIRNARGVTEFGVLSLMRASEYRFEKRRIESIILMRVSI